MTRKKAIYTLNIGNYAPEITALTYPLLERYAKKIGADFVIIRERKFPDYPLLYEKMQLYELGKDNDWNIYIDSDCLVHPDLFDITEILPEDTVLNYGVDFANTRFTYDNYFRRDGRNIGSGNFFTVASHLCLEIWEPFSDITLEEALGNIHTAYFEEAIGRTPGHIIDDYTISRNIARYGFKFKTFLQLLQDIGRPKDDYLFHSHRVREKDKLPLIQKTLKEWGFHT